MPYNSIQINNLEAEELHPYRTLRRPQEHFSQGIFIAEGEKVVRRLLDSQLTVISILLTPEWMHELQPQLDKREEDIELFVAPKEIVETIVGFNLHQGLMAAVRVPENQNADRILPSLPSPSLLVALDGLVNAENVGVIVRNCAAFGVNAIIVGETSSSPYLRRAVRNSMGAIFQMPVIHVQNLAASLQELQNKYRYTIAAAHPAGGHSVYEIDLSGNTCIVLGNEGDGVRQSILDVSPVRLSIPMQNNIDSLNVANASAVLLYEVNRQRHNGK